LRGISLRIIQRQLGYCSIMTTEHYAHVADESLTAAIETLDAAVPSTPKRWIDDLGRAPAGALDREVRSPRPVHGEVAPSTAASAVTGRGRPARCRPHGAHQRIWSGRVAK